MSPFLTCLDFGVCAPQSASFALATTHSLDVLLNASRPYHRSPSACLEGTHGDRVAGDNANAIDFVTIASSLRATSSTRIDKYRPLVISLRFVRQLRNNTAQSLVLCTQGLPLGKNKRTSACILKMKAKFLSCGKRSTKNQGEQLQLVVVEAKGACVRRKLGAPRLAALRLALRISTLRL